MNQTRDACDKSHIVREDNRRVPKANWFELIAALDDEDTDLVRIGSGAELRATRAAPLYLFANDLNSRYDNNEGCLKATIRRTR